MRRLSSLTTTFLAVPLLLGLAGTARAQGTPTYDTAQLPATKGKVSQYLLNPRGSVDGLLLDDAWCAFFKKHDFVVGLSVDGNIDYGRDRVLLNGTFVPAYGLNNLFSQIPLFGPIIGGGSHEGLFAVNFQVSGAASAPVLNINPLSAIAPGFLRKIFGAGIPRSPSPPAPIPQTAPPMPMTIGPGR